MWVNNYIVRIHIFWFFFGADSKIIYYAFLKYLTFTKVGIILIVKYNKTHV